MTKETIRNGSTSITVPIEKSIIPGESVIFDMSKYFECKNQLPNSFIDYMQVVDNGLSTILNDDFHVGMNFSGQKYTIPVPLITIFQLTDGAWHNLPIKLSYHVNDYPGKMLHIHAGQTIASLQLYKYSDPPQTFNHFTWSIIAGNDAILTSGTCEINHGREIVVNFGSLVQQKLGANPIRRRHVRIPYQCKNPIDISIKMTLSADKSAFSSQLIKTSNQALAVGLLFNDKIIAPGKSFSGQLHSGIGESSLDFELIRDNRQTVEVGKFDGNAILVMSVL